MKSTLYLASASPRRHELLNQIGIAHEILYVPSPPGEDEPRLETESPLQYVQRTAFDKAVRAQSYVEQKIVEQKILACDTNQNHIAILTADTTVALGNIILGKPKDAQDAKEILRMLSGQTHIVYTAVVLSRASTYLSNIDAQRDIESHIQWTHSRALSTTQVHFSDISDDLIQEYLATKEAFGKAGAYGIQGHAAKFIQRIEGSYSGVMGLPLYETGKLIHEKG
jgi:septum formation protein